jgi:two-component system sensor histidine kinase MprB
MLASLQQASASERCFLADASHELRTPVTALLGNVEYAGRHGLDTELLADLRRDATRLARLVDDLLVLERAGSTIGETRLESVALDEWARQFAASHDGAVTLAAAAHARARVDPDALARAAGNLVENALIHGPPGGGVTIAVRRDAGYACLTVRDDGPGPDPADLPHVFERFWRGAAASERPGSGLGLAIAAAIAQRLGGRITVVGSAFTIELPLDDPPPDR